MRHDDFSKAMDDAFNPNVPLRTTLTDAIDEALNPMSPHRSLLEKILDNPGRYRTRLERVLDREFN